MKTLSRIASVTIASFAIIGLVAISSRPATAETTSTTKGALFCKNISAYAAKINSSIDSLTGKLSTARATQAETTKTNVEKWDADITANREKWDQQRQENFAKLEAKAETDEQKAAVKAYEETVTNAVKARRDAFDNARATFRSGVSTTVSSHKTTVDGQLTSFKQAISSAVSTAETACKSNPNDTSIRTTFVNNLKTARETFRSNRQSDANIKTSVKSLWEARNQSFKAALQTFDATMKTARETLKKAFTGSNAQV